MFIKEYFSKHIIIIFKTYKFQNVLNTSFLYVIRPHAFMKIPSSTYWYFMLQQKLLNSSGSSILWNYVTLFSIVLTPIVTMYQLFQQLFSLAVTHRFSLEFQLLPSALLPLLQYYQFLLILKVFFQ